MKALAGIFTSIPALRQQIELAIRRNSADESLAGRLRGLLGRFEADTEAEKLCDPSWTPSVVAAFVEVSGWDRDFRLGIGEGVAAARKGFAGMVRRSPSAPLPGTVPTWAAVLDPAYLSAALTEARSRAMADRG